LEKKVLKKLGKLLEFKGAVEKINWVKRGNFKDPQQGLKGVFPNP